ncbi:MAG: DUF4854 domain-containing protein [Lachnospiraceae bacterium]|nr:DUF4854 domain-containing protein [Lachnospiraceae bacterium]
MKKRSLKLLACATMLTLAFSLGACSSDKESSKGSDKKTESSSDNKKSDKAYSSMKDFVESDELQSQIKPLTDSLAGSGMNLEIKADGNKFIYSFKYETLTKADLAGGEAQLEQELTAQQSTYKGLASELTKSVDVKDPIVVVEYLDSNDEVIYSQEFTAD